MSSYNATKTAASTKKKAVAGTAFTPAPQPAPGGNQALVQQIADQPPGAGPTGGIAGPQPGTSNPLESSRTAPTAFGGQEQRQGVTSNGGLTSVQGSQQLQPGRADTAVEKAFKGKDDIVKKDETATYSSGAGDEIPDPLATPEVDDPTANANSEMEQFFEDMMGKEEERMKEAGTLQQQQASVGHRRQMEMSAQLGQSVGGGGFSAGQAQAQIQSNQDMTKMQLDHMDRMRDLSMKGYEEKQRGRERKEGQEFQKEREMMGYFQKYQQQQQQLMLDPANADFYTENPPLDYETWKTQFEGGGALPTPTRTNSTQESGASQAASREDAGSSVFNGVKHTIPSNVHADLERVLQEAGGDTDQAISIYMKEHVVGPQGQNLMDNVRIMKALGQNTFGLENLSEGDLIKLKDTALGEMYDLSQVSDFRKLLETLRDAK